MKTAQLLCMIVLPLSAAAVLAQDRRKWSFDSQWLFLRGDAAGAERAEYDDSGWRRLDVPHDWSIEDLPPDTSASGQSIDARSGPFDHLGSPGKESTGWTVGGTGWYRKHFRVPDLAPASRVEFASTASTWTPTSGSTASTLGNHPYGYTRFRL